MEQTITPKEMISILPESEYFVAMQFVDIADRLGLIPKIRYAKGHKSWKCVYNRKKPSRVIFTIECTESKWHIKACLFHIDSYIETVYSCSDFILNTLKYGYNCISCNTHCKGGFEFRLNNEKYKKCFGNCFYFTNLSSMKYQELLNLIEMETINL